MAQRRSIGGKVVVLLKDDVDYDSVSTFFVIGHGTKVDNTFIADMIVYFPWGIDNFGWYESDTGFPLMRIYDCYRRGANMGLTDSKTYEQRAVETPGSLFNTLATPLLTKEKNEVPNINVTPRDLNVEFCEKMLESYYHEVVVEDVGIVCLTGDEKLCDMLRYLNLSKKDSYSDLLAICLCCSVKKGDEHNAGNRAQGYKPLD